MEPQGALEGEVELVNGLEEGEPGPPGEPLDAGLLPVGHLLGNQDGEEVAVRPAFGLGSLDEGAVDAAGVGQV
jgi:hypothetical protein